MRNSYDIEIDEAIVAGRNAIAALQRAESALQSARSFGFWDLLGGGFISGMLKHSRMRDAQYEMENAQRELARFRKELADVQLTGTINIEFDGAIKFFDLFFDNFFVDLMVQSRIKEMIANLQQTRYQVEDAVQRLQNYRR